MQKNLFVNSSHYGGRAARFGDNAKVPRHRLPHARWRTYKTENTDRPLLSMNHCCQPTRPVAACGPMGRWRAHIDGGIEL